MREVDVNEITRSVKELCIQAATELGDDVVAGLKAGLEKEESASGRSVLEQLIENAETASDERIPICQDTGYAVVFLEVGQEVHFTGGTVWDAVTEGVKEGYGEGYLRKSIVKNPLLHPENTHDNTPPIVHTDIVPGDKVKITILPKGGGSENMSRVGMLKPADGLEGLKDFVVETVRKAGPNPCPPVIVGVGVGGTFDYVAYLAKKSLLRKIGERSPDDELADVEREWLTEVNKLGIGPAGLGGRVTALDLFIEAYPRHIASFPVAVNIQCHAARAKTRFV